MAIENLREVQLRMLKLLDAFDAFCREHGLTWWLDFGTLLGARRHGGFIPWDDDLDVSMPLEDYRRFLSLAPSGLPEWIFLQHRSTEPSFPNHFIKLRDRESCFVEAHEEGHSVGYHQGIFIDVFPAAFLPSSRVAFYRALLYGTKLFGNRYLRMPFAAEAGIALLDRFHDPLHGDTVAAGGESLHWFAPYPKAALMPLSTLEFEGKPRPVPADTDLVLRHVFGPDFMELPPPQKRRTHCVRADTRKPCPEGTP